MKQQYWQLCPKCNGNGNIFANTTTGLNQCPICKGAMIISSVTGLPPDYEANRLEREKYMTESERKMKDFIQDTRQRPLTEKDCYPQESQDLRSQAFPRTNSADELLAALDYKKTTIQEILFADGVPLEQVEGILKDYDVEVIHDVTYYIHKETKVRFIYNTVSNKLMLAKIY